MLHLGKSTRTFLAILFALCLLFALFPVVSFKVARDGEESIGGQLHGVSSTRSFWKYQHVPDIMVAEGEASPQDLSGKAHVRITYREALFGRSNSQTKLGNVNGHRSGKETTSATWADKIHARRSGRVLYSHADKLSKVGYMDSGGRQLDIGVGNLPVTFANSQLLQTKQWKEKVEWHPQQASTRLGKGKVYKLIKEAEGETVAHGLIKVKRTHGLEDEIHQKQQGEESLATAEKASRQMGLHWKKVGTKNISDHRRGKVYGSRFVTAGQEQIHNLVAALRRSGLYAAVAGIIEGMNLPILPQFATVFVPTDSAYQTIKQSDKSIQLYEYHIAMQRYTFVQLCGLKEGDFLWSYIPGQKIVVTGNQPLQFTLDGVRLIAPELYLDDTIAVHGIDGIFNCTIYGQGFVDHAPEMVAPPSGTAVNTSSTAPVSSPTMQGPGPSSNGSMVAGTEAQPNQAPSNEQDAGFNPSPGSTTPLALLPMGLADTETDSDDTDASDYRVTAKTGVCAAVITFVSALLILCC